MNSLWLIYGLAFVAGILLIEGLYWLYFDLHGTKKAINRRLALSETSKSQGQILDILRVERGFADFENPTLTKLNDFVVQTGLRLSKTVVAAVTAVGVATIALVLMAFSVSPLIAAAAGAIGAPAAVAVYLAGSRRKRIDRFAQQLPDALEVIVRGLRVGHPFSSAIELVAKEMPDPIGSELGITADEMTFGQDVNTAVANLYRRVGQDDLLFLTIAVSIQSQTGGNLANVLERLGTLMRQRITMTLKIRALSAEGRMSAWFLSAMPFVLYALVQVTSPSYYTELRGTDAVIPALIYGLGSLLVANFVIYRMVNFKV